MKKKPVFITLGAILGVLVVLYGLKAFGIYRMIQQFSSQKPPPVSVSATLAKREEWQPRVEAIGSLRAVQGVDVASEVPGKVERILFESGATVRRGELLVQLDDSTEQAQLPGARAQLELARANFQRTRRLIEQGLASAEQLDSARSQLQQAESTVASLEATIAKKAIRAPFAGRLGIRRVDAGQYLAAGTRIVTLQALDELYVDFTLPEQYFGRLRAGQQVEVSTAVAPDTLFRGEIVAVDAVLDPTTRNFAVRARLENPGEKLLPGMFARVAVLAGEPYSVVTVPRTAVSYSLYGDAVYVITEERNENGEVALKATQTFVRTGDVRNGRVEILSGVQPGDRVVTAGQLKLQKESHVAINNEVALN